MLRETFWANAALADRYVKSSPAALERMRRQAEERVLAHVSAVEPEGPSSAVASSTVLDPQRVVVEVTVPRGPLQRAVLRFLYMTDTADVLVPVV